MKSISTRQFSEFFSQKVGGNRRTHDGHHKGSPEVAFFGKRQLQPSVPEFAEFNHQNNHKEHTERPGCQCSLVESPTNENDYRHAEKENTEKDKVEFAGVVPVLPFG